MSSYCIVKRHLLKDFKTNTLYSKCLKLHSDLINRVPHHFNPIKFRAVIPLVWRDSAHLFIQFESQVPGSDGFIPGTKSCWREAESRRSKRQGKRWVFSLQKHTCNCLSYPRTDRKWSWTKPWRSSVAVPLFPRQCLNHRQDVHPTHSSPAQKIWAFLLSYPLVFLFHYWRCRALRWNQALLTQVSPNRRFAGPWCAPSVSMDIYYILYK